MRVDQLNWQVLRLVFPKHSYQTTISQFIGDLVVQQAGGAQALHAGQAGGADLVAGQAWGDFFGLFFLAVAVVPVAALGGEEDASVVLQCRRGIDGGALLR